MPQSKIFFLQIKLIKSYVKQCHLTYEPITENHDITLFTDALFGKLPNGGRQGAYLIYSVGNDNKCNLISWQSKRIKRVAKSSLAAETLALYEGVNSANK